MPDPRNEPDGANDQDKHGRKQNAGSRQDEPRTPGSDVAPASDDMRREHEDRKRPPPA